ncbi:MAG: DUF2309 domain-containing protein [Isosphaeraceae bacterium]|nr:DUF2309 domain-containing protein [Isosphaeraceae bacterium]
MPTIDLENSTSLYTLPPSGSYHEPDLLRLEELIEYVARLLPAEGPIASFVFQNPLHAFEYLPFDAAVQQGARAFRCQPYLSEARYREELGKKRIEIVDLRSVLEEDEVGDPWESVAGIVRRLNLRLTMLLNPFCLGSVEEMRWFVAETEALSRFRDNAPTTARGQIVADAKRWVVRDLINAGSDNGAFQAPGPDDPRRKHLLWPLLPQLGSLLSGEDRSSTDAWSDSVWESFSIQSLWRVCCEGVRRVLPAGEFGPQRKMRLREALLEATGVDSDLLVHDMLIRFCAAFTDQGLAHWALPKRDQGFFRTFCHLYGQPGGPPTPWLRGLYRELVHLQEERIEPMESIRESLDELGVCEDEWEWFLPATLLALKGWGSMIRQMEVRPDRVPSPVARGTLIEFLAVRLILERQALTHVARQELGYDGPLCDLRGVLESKRQRKAPDVAQRAFPVFQLAQVLGWQPSTLYSLSPEQWTALVGEIEGFSNVERRRVFHRAYERRYRLRALDAVGTRAGMAQDRPEHPPFQAVFCIDAREESFRRHLEELCPSAETFGAAGFFSVPIYYRGAADAHAVASCPIVVRPQHWVEEEVTYSLAHTHRSRAAARKLLGETSRRFNLGSRTFALGAICTGGLGILASFPLIGRVLFPAWTAKLTKLAGSIVAPPSITRLAIERIDAVAGPDGDHVGFSVDEMATIGERVLRDIGLTSNFGRLVLFLGHGSQCQNNPHKSAYDCGACSGNPGGPNARALASMLNDPRVRQTLAGRGLIVPWSTVFLGGLHNTGDDTITFYDVDLMPRSHSKDFEAMRETLEKACEQNARERCRRFYSAPLNLTADAARRHTHARTEDLAQTRPEFGNATNALCIVGRRERTRGLFLDRRSFLHSYDPTQDPDHSILARILAAVVPVCAGINLQYFFSAVDPSGWGAGTKLPHNVTSMLGVMDGSSSDLRQGLPWQGVEIHEPLRLLFVIEAEPETMQKIMSDNPVIGRLLRNGWSQLAVLSPESSELRIFQNGEFVLYQPGGQPLPVAGSSVEWYTGRRDHLEFALIEN